MTLDATVSPLNTKTTLQRRVSPRTSPDRSTARRAMRARDAPQPAHVGLEHFEQSTRRHMMSWRVASVYDVIRCQPFWFLMSAVLAADAFFARIVPYRTIVSVAVPPEYARAAAVSAAVGVGAAHQSTHGEEATSKDASSAPVPCANCIGLASSNAYLNLSHPLGVVMVRREHGFPYEGVARRVAREAASLGGVLVTPTTSSNRARVTLEDAQAIAEALRKANSALVDVPFGYWDGEDTESWRDLTATEASADGHPAAAVRSAERLQSFLESTQGALNTFG